MIEEKYVMLFHPAKISSTAVRRNNKQSVAYLYYANSNLCLSSPRKYLDLMDIFGHVEN